MSLTTASILAALVIGLNLAATALAADTAAMRSEKSFEIEMIGLSR